ncbi:MAG: tetratricopeptide repeat protein [Chlorobi bacterium]|nr:tetratricopeptide repeat protein [Chlorobiota bacterium]
MSNKKHAEQPVEVVENVLTKTEQYIEDNQKSLLIIVAVIAVIVGGYLGFQKFYVAPMEIEAESQMFTAERYFETDSFNLALNGDGEELGFLDIIDDYGLTKSANLAHYYAGISYLHMGDYENAVEYLKLFDSDDQMVGPLALAATGDAYIELGDKEKAISFYLKSIDKSDNSLLTPIFLMKIGNVYEKLGQFEKAIEMYTRIKKDYKRSIESRSVDKYITRAKIEMNK